MSDPLQERAREVARAIGLAVWKFVDSHDMHDDLRGLIEHTLPSMYETVERIYQTSAAENLRTGESLLLLNAQDCSSVMSCRLDELLRDDKSMEVLQPDERPHAWVMVAKLMSEGNPKQAAALAMMHMGREKLLDWQMEMRRSAAADPNAIVVSLVFVGYRGDTENPDKGSSFGFVSFVELPKSLADEKLHSLH